MSSLMWTKSSFSTNDGACVETAKDGGHMLMRDSKDPDGPRLSFLPGEWDAFLDGIRNGEFDHLTG